MYTFNTLYYMINKKNMFSNEEENIFNTSEENCPVLETILSAIFVSKPLGLLWDEDIIVEFLKEKGYKIVERVDENGETYLVPVKSESKYIPDSKNMLRKVFDREIQRTLIKWLLNGK